MDNKATGARGLPRLDEFDQEFGSAPGGILHEDRRRIRARLLVGLLLAAGLIGVATLAWVNADLLGSLARSDPTTVQSASLSPSPSPSRSAMDEKMAHLVHEIATLRRELGDLRHAYQQALERISSLQADLRLRQAPPQSWYSDSTALSFESASPSRSPATAPRRAAVRPEARDSRRGDSTEPLSLGAPQ
jgi:hypothetical protein